MRPLRIVVAILVLALVVAFVFLAICLTRPTQASVVPCAEGTVHWPASSFYVVVEDRTGPVCSVVGW